MTFVTVSWFAYPQVAYVVAVHMVKRVSGWSSGASTGFGSTRRRTGALFAAVALCAAVPVVAELDMRPAGAATAMSPVALGGLASAPGGKWLVDPQGRRLLLTGVNLVAKCSTSVVPETDYPGTPCLPTGDAPAGTLAYLLSPDAKDPGRRFTDADAQTLEDLGVDEVRLGIIWDGLEPGPAGAKADDPRWCSRLPAGADPKPLTGAATVYNAAVAQAYLKGVDVTVDLLAKHGIRSLIDMHQDAWGGQFGNTASHWHGEGAPLWATCTDHLPSSHPTSFAASYADLPEVAALGHFWANDVSGNLMGEYARIWKVVAQHFNDNPNVLGYDVYNEPADFTLATGTFGQKLQCAYAGTAQAPFECATAGSRYNPGLIPVIQSADPGHVVFVEPPVLQDFGVPNTFGLASLPFHNVGLSFHDYGLTSGFAVPGSKGCTTPTCPLEEANSMLLSMQQRDMIKTLQPGGPAALLSEFGATDDSATANRVANLADTNLISWMYWSGLQLHDPSGTPSEGLVDDTTRESKPGMAAAVARPHAAAVAGTPTQQSFDMTTKVFSFAWVPDPKVTAPTVIRVPVMYQYPHSYRVTVTGGRVIERTTDGRVAVTADSTDTVTVHIEPAV